MNTNPPTSFYGLNIAPSILKRLDELKFVTPTPIQYKAIPIGIDGEDLIGIAQTGTGKTLAFTIPMIQRLAATRQEGLILCPTRELAIQVNETLEKIGKRFKLRTTVIIGGANIKQQIKALRAKPHIVVATPGRLIDHMNQGTISLKNIGVLVLDEADRMLDMGFEPQIKKILAEMPSKRQTMLFSATMPAKIAEIARKYMAKPLRVEVAPSGTTAEQIEHELFVVPRPQKMALLEKILSEYHGSILIFSRTKHGAKKMTRIINQIGHTATEIHSNRSLSQRRKALDGFKSGRFRIMVATDIAARGIDVTDIELVINFDLPENSEDYVHRVGRTGRAGMTGKAISFACPEQGRDVTAIESLIKIQLPITSLPEHIAEAAKNNPPERSRGFSGSRRRPGGGRPARRVGQRRGAPRRRTRR